MDIVRILAQLREQLANIDAAISAMERLQGEKGRRGRPASTAQSLQENRGVLPVKRRKTAVRGSHE